MRIIIMLAAITISGCSLFPADNELRVTEYGTGWLTGSVGGCRVVSNGEMKGIEIIYDGEKCKVRKVHNVGKVE